jgi:hypothetical protein
LVSMILKLTSGFWKSGSWRVLHVLLLHCHTHRHIQAQHYTALSDGGG